MAGSHKDDGDKGHDPGASNRGQRPSTGSGEVHGSGANAGGGGSTEDYDNDFDHIRTQPGGK